MARPIADSAAATVKTSKAKTWPITSSIEFEKITKFKLIANNISSIDISIIKMFFRFNTIPNKPIKNKRVLRIKYCSIEKKKEKNGSNKDVHRCIGI